jgi:hypothetical protein
MRVGQHQGDAVHRRLYFATWGGISGRDEEDQRKASRSLTSLGWVGLKTGEREVGNASSRMCLPYARVRSAPALVRHGIAGHTDA